MNLKNIGSLAAIVFLTLLSGNGHASPCTAPHSIKRVQNYSPGGRFEYVIFEIVSSPMIPYAVGAATPPFIADPSGLEIAVKGGKFEKIRFTNVFWTCDIKERLSLPETAIKDVKKLGQFEGVVEYVIGYRTASHYSSTHAYRLGSNWKVVMKFKK